MGQASSTSAARGTATLRLLRAITALGPRLHETARTGPEQIYALVCDTLRNCGLSAHIARLDADGVLRIVAISLDPAMVAGIEAMIGARFIGSPIVSPVYERIVDHGEAEVVPDVAAILEPIVPQLSAQQRAELARQADAERALLAPFVVGAAVSGVLSVWGPRSRLRVVVSQAVVALAAQVGIALENDRLLRQSEEEHARWRATVDSMADMVVTVDPDGRLTYMNAGAERLFGPKPMDLPLGDYLSIVPLYRPDGAPAAPDDLPLEQARRAGQPVTDSLLILRLPDGSERHTLWSAAPVRMPDGAVVGAVATGRDVTFQRVLEELNRAALHVLLRVADIVTETADASTLLDRLAEALSHLAAVDQAHAMLLTGDTPEPVAIYGVVPEVATAWADAVRAFAPPPEVAQPLLQRFRAGRVLTQDFAHDGTIISNVAVNAGHIRAAMTAPVFLGGALVGLLTISRTRPPAPAFGTPFAPWDEELLAGVARLAGEALERARLREQLLAARAARRAAEEATRQRDEFLGVASHELRTPLTSMRMNIQLAQRRVAAASGDAQTALLLERTDRQIRRLTRLVGDLVDTARIAADKLELRADDYDLAAVVHEAVEEQRDEGAGDRIRLTLPDGPVPLHGDAVRVGQVVTNYLTNALKYSPSHAPVDVRLDVDATGREARVSVRDQGPGLPPGEQASVWQRFHQAEGVHTQTGSGVGLGLGLYISRTIVERHGGRVGIESAPGAGSAFWFTLPLEATPALVAEAESSLGAEDGDTPSGAGDTGGERRSV